MATLILLFALSWASWANDFVVTQADAVRVRDVHLQRKLECPHLRKGTALRVLGREFLQGDWWLEVEAEGDCRGYVLEDNTAFRVFPDWVPESEEILADPSVVQEMRFLAGVTSAPDQQILKRSRGLYRFPVRKQTTHVGPCGSFHYNPDSEDLVDSYINKKVGCGFLDIIKKWRTSECPDIDRGCRLQWGDISHKTKLRWSGHRTHTHGHCIDLRPMRVGEFVNSPMWIQNELYDSEMTEKLIRLMRSHGATTVLFNDPRIIRLGLSRYKGNHHNHIHVCFKNNSKLTKMCENFEFNEKACQNLAKGRMR